MSAIYRPPNLKKCVPGKIVQPFPNFFTIIDAFNDINALSLIEDNNSTLGIKGLIAGDNIELQEGDGTITITNTSEVSSITSAGGSSLVVDGIGPEMVLRGLSSGSGISLSSNNNSITISSTLVADVVTLEGTNVGESLVSDGVGPDLVTKDVVAGNGINLTSDNDSITITSLVIGGNEVTLTNTGSGETLVSDGVGPDLATKSITAGNGIDLTSDGDNITITSLVIGGNEVTLANAGSGESLVSDGVGPDLFTKSIAAGTGISLSSDNDNITINSTVVADAITLAGTNVGETLVSDGVGPDLVTKDVVAGNGINLTSDNDSITITSLVIGGNEVTLTNTGSGETLVSDGVGPDLATKSITAGNGINLTSDVDNITITSLVIGGNEVSLSGTNVGETLVSDGVGPDLVTKDVVAGNGINLTSDNDSITITSLVIGGNEVSLTNAGSGETLISDGSGPDLSTKSLTAGNGIDITSDADNITITSTVVGGDEVSIASTGTGETLVSDGSGPDLVIKNVVAGDGMHLTSDTNELTVNSNSITNYLFFDDFNIAIPGPVISGSGTDSGLATIRSRESFYIRGKLETIQIDEPPSGSFVGILLDPTDGSNFAMYSPTRLVLGNNPITFEIRLRLTSIPTDHYFFIGLGEVSTPGFNGLSSTVANLNNIIGVFSNTGSGGDYRIVARNNVSTVTNVLSSPVALTTDFSLFRMVISNNGTTSTAMLYHNNNLIHTTSSSFLPIFESELCPFIGLSLSDQEPSNSVIVDYIRLTTTIPGRY